MDELSITVGRNNATDLPDDLVEDETFSLDGYQVVRGEFLLIFLSHPLHSTITKFPLIQLASKNFHLQILFKFWLIRKKRNLQ